MKNSLLGKIGKKILKPVGKKALPFLIGGMSLVLGGCQPDYDEELDIGGSKICYNSIRNFSTQLDWDVKEIKFDGTIIKYDIEPDLHTLSKGQVFGLEDFKIDGEKYKNFPRVMDSARRRVKEIVERYLFVEDSTNKRNQYLKDSTKRAKGLEAFK